MNEHAARDVLLVRALETAQPPVDAALWSDDDRAWASAAAAREAGTDPAARAGFVAARAQRAARRIGEREPALARAATGLRWRPSYAWLTVAIATIAGLLTDALGAGGRVNLLALPLLGIVAWNVAVYAALVLATMGAGREVGDRVAAGFVRAVGKRAGRVADTAAPATRAVLGRFLGDWAGAGMPLAGRRVAGALHAAAAAFAAAVLISLYVRGLALEYRAGWESTFLGAGTVHAILAFVLGPASALTGIAIPDAGRLAQLRFPGAPGEIAAPWIHLYATTLALIVIVPRALLALAAARAAHRLATDFPLPIEGAYFDAMLAGAGGEAAWVRVVPYALRVDESAAQPLRTLLATSAGPGLRLSVADPVPFGAEHDDETAARRALAMGDRAPVLVVALFALAATPEPEHHGAFLARLARELPEHLRLAVAVDEGGFLARFAGDPARLEQRRAAWRRLAREFGHETLFVALDAAPAPAPAAGEATA